MVNGGIIVGWSNMYFGYFCNFIVFGIVVNMGDGWEIVCRVCCYNMIFLKFDYVVD